MDVETVLIPAAGLGTRMRAVARGLPKELLPVDGKPAIAWALAEAAHAGAKLAVIIVRPGKEAVRRAVESMKSFPRSMAVEFVDQENLLGECDALSAAAHLAGTGGFGVVYPDNIYLGRGGNKGRPGAVRLLGEFMDAWGPNLVALSRTTEQSAEGTGDSGRVEVEPLARGVYDVRAFLPKGGGAFRQRFAGELRTCGIYLAGPEYFRFIEETRAQGPDWGPGNELTDGKVRRLMLERGVSFRGIALPGRVFDIGNPRGYALCLEALKSS